MSCTPQRSVKKRFFLRQFLDVRACAQTCGRADGKGGGACVTRGHAWHAVTPDLVAVIRDGQGRRQSKACKCRRGGWCHRRAHLVVVAESLPACRSIIAPTRRQQPRRRRSGATVTELARPQRHQQTYVAGATALARVADVPRVCGPARAAPSQQGCDLGAAATAWLQSATIASCATESTT